MQAKKRPISSMMRPIPAHHSPAMTIPLPVLEIIDEFCLQNNASLDPSYMGDGSRGCMSIAITIPDSVKLPGLFLAEVIKELRKTRGEDCKICAYMLRNTSIIKSGQQKTLVFPRLSATE